MGILVQWGWIARHLACLRWTLLNSAQCRERKLFWNEWRALLYPPLISPCWCHWWCPPLFSKRQILIIIIYIVRIVSILLSLHSAIFVAIISDRIQGFVESLFVESHLGGATDNEVPTHYADTQLKFFSLSGSPKSFQNPDFVILDNFVFAGVTIIRAICFDGKACNHHNLEITTGSLFLSKHFSHIHIGHDALALRNEWRRCLKCTQVLIAHKAKLYKGCSVSRVSTNRAGLGGHHQDRGGQCVCYLLARTLASMCQPLERSRQTPTTQFIPNTPKCVLYQGLCKPNYQK